MALEQITTQLKRLREKLSKPPAAIILGAGSAEYAIYCKLVEERSYKVLFFIDDDPWAHRSKLGTAELRYPVELASLCENHNVAAVFYCDKAKAKDLPSLHCDVIYINAQT